MIQDELKVPDMPYMKDIFKILRTGAFISEDCLSESSRRFYRAIDTNFQAYFKYFDQLGYYLEKGNGYVHLCEEKSSSSVQSRLRTDIGTYVPMLHAFLKFNAELAPGHQFKTYELQRFFDENDELKSILPSSDDGHLSTRVNIFLKGAVKEGFIDLSVDESTCMVTSAFRYLKEYVTRIKLYGEHAKFNYGIEEKLVPKSTKEEPQNAVINGLADNGPKE